ncbi:MBL fold metallo-hydrolase [Chloroflexota bacterium]
MIPIQELAKGIFKIGPLETHSRTPDTSPHLVVGDKLAAIVEPGEGGQVPELIEAIKMIGVDLDRVAYAIASHSHLHHLAGVNVLLKELPKIKMVVHNFAVPHLLDPTRLNAGTIDAWGQGCPQISPVSQDRIWGVSGGEVIDLGGRELEIVETLGHSPHHIAIFDRLTKALFAGDAAGVLQLGSERASPDIRPPFFDVDKASGSLQRLRALNPSMLLLFGYGGISFSPQKTLQWSEDDIRTVERICREGMQKKISGKEIGRQVAEYYEQVGATMPPEPKHQGRGQERIGMRESDAPIGMIAFLMKQDPTLELPK